MDDPILCLHPAAHDRAANRHSVAWAGIAPRKPVQPEAEPQRWFSSACFE